MTATPAAAARPDRPGWLAHGKERIKHVAHGALGPVVSGLASVGIQPDHLTWIGLGFGVLAGLAFFDGPRSWRIAALLLALSGLCDILDGELARKRGQTSRFGAFLDSTLDRLSEAFVLLGIAAFGASNLEALVLDPGRAARELEIGLEPVAWVLMVLLAGLSLVGSFMVSYTRARAEGLGLECKVGWFERPERLILLIAAASLPVFWAMPVALLILTVLSFTTAAQRVVHVFRHTRTAGRD